jgi:transposase InsO family protein
METEIKRRLRWVKLYEQTGNAGLVCLKCGISRPPLRLWWRRYQEQGIEGLVDHSSRPHQSPAKKTFELQEQWIAQLRQRRLGARRIQSELLRQQDCSLSLATIHKVLRRQQQPPLKTSRRPRHTVHRYAREVPGERVQMDTCKIQPGLYQYTAVDDCTRFRVLCLYPRRSAANTLLFIERANEEMPFPIQRIQTDRGREFFAYKVQEQLMAYGIKFRPIKPRSPHLNGKVERSQKTDWEEFYSTVDLTSPDLEQKLEAWQDYYNQGRPHGSLHGKTPWERWLELLHQTPYRDEIEALYDA